VDCELPLNQCIPNVFGVIPIPLPIVEFLLKNILSGWLYENGRYDSGGRIKTLSLGKFLLMVGGE
jgi:hypothetical protein